MTYKIIRGTYEREGGCEVSREELTLSADPCNTRMGLSGAKPALISGFSRFSPRVNISAIPIRVPVSWFNFAN